MKSIDGRLRKLEDRFGLVENKPRFVLMLDGAGSKRALSNDDCIQILAEAGFLPPSGSCIVDFTVIPHGLNAKEEERFVRENGAQLCGSRRVGGPDIQGDARTSPRSAVPVVFNVQMDHWKGQLAPDRPGNEDVR
jgi:hypothetical protein